jgi:hypothetical protein
MPSCPALKRPEEWRSLISPIQIVALRGYRKAAQSRRYLSKKIKTVFNLKERV